LLVAWLLLAALAPAAVAQQTEGVPPNETGGKLIVGLFEVPPFTVKDGQGNWDGIAVRLWTYVADDLDLDYELREMSPADLLEGLETTRLTAVVTAVATAESERLIEFSHPYYSSGLGIAVPAPDDTPNWLVVLGTLVSWDFLKIVIGLVILLTVAAIFMWFFERRANAEQFNQHPAKGVGDGMWWAAVTMTTVGYGDKAPRSRAGRVVAVIWMFTSVVLITVFTAQVTSTLTVSGLTGRVRGAADLPHVRVGALQQSPAQNQLLISLGVVAVGYGSYDAGLDALANGEIDAFVAGEPILRYEVNAAYQGRIRVLGSAFLRQDYAIGLPLDSPLRKRINESLLHYILSDEWQNVLREFLSEQAQ